MSDVELGSTPLLIDSTYGSVRNYYYSTLQTSRELGLAPPCHACQELQQKLKTRTHQLQQKLTTRTHQLRSATCVVQVFFGMMAGMSLIIAVLVVLWTNTF